MYPFIFKYNHYGSDRPLLWWGEKRSVLASLNGGTIKDSSGLVPGLSLIKLPANKTVADSLSPFRESADILYAYPNHYGRGILATPDDTRFSEQWALYNTGQSGGTVDADIDAPEAWDTATGSGDIIVAVIDTGVDYTHPDLAANMWVNPGEDHEPLGVIGPEDFDGIDDDDNKLTDDICGYDFSNDDGDPYDDYNYMGVIGHGTHCAGIVGAAGNNNKGIAGVNWDVRLMALKWMDDAGDGESWDIVYSIEYAVDMGARVLSNSYSHPYKYQVNQAIFDVIEAAHEAGCLFVASSGNDGDDNDAEPFYPASYDLDNIISVLATNKYDNEWGSSNYGATSVDLGAPGAGILSCAPGNRYLSYSGTSLACPHVAGACALLWSRNPALSHLEVKDIILDTVDVLDDLENHPVHGRLCVTGGRLNLHSAILAVSDLFLDIEDDLDPGVCVSPDDQITYTITLVAGTETHQDAVLTDRMSKKVDFIRADPNTGTYDPNSHSYIWQIGTIAPDDPNGYFTVTVKVNEYAEPIRKIVNKAELITDLTHLRADEWASVCCWSDVIYVNCLNDPNVIDPDVLTGATWALAYADLHRALAKAAEGCGDEIWVAAGVYPPTMYANEPDASFELLNNVAIYGGFGGSESFLDERNCRLNKTYLTGNIDFAGAGECDYVVTAGEGIDSSAVIDGFFITGSTKAGVYCNFGSPTITNCVIRDNAGKGLHCKNSDASVSRCAIKDNDEGIRAEGQSPTIKKCIIHANDKDGIYCYHTGKATIINNWIYANKDDGIRFDTPGAQATVRNNTIADNVNCGISQYYGTAPNITNCIIWGNDDDLYECSATYSCISDCGDVGNPSVTHNNCVSPLFAYADPNDFHLHPDSPCIDKGDNTLVDPNGLGETDIDGNERVLDGDGDDEQRVDMGADEVSCDDIYNDLDWTGDRIIDVDDLVILAKAWLSDDTPTSNWNPYCDIQPEIGDGDVDYGDFVVFGLEWLWQPCWVSSEMSSSMLGSSVLMAGPEPAAIQQDESSIPSEPTVEEQIEQLEILLDWLDEIKDEIDEDIWLNLSTSLEEMLKELEDSY